MISFEIYLTIIWISIDLPKDVEPLYDRAIHDFHSSTVSAKQSAEDNWKRVTIWRLLGNAEQNRRQLNETLFKSIDDSFDRQKTQMSAETLEKERIGEYFAIKVLSLIL